MRIPKTILQQAKNSMKKNMPVLLDCHGSVLGVAEEVKLPNPESVYVNKFKSVNLNGKNKNYSSP